MRHSPGGVVAARARMRSTMSACDRASVTSTSGSAKAPKCRTCGCVSTRPGRIVAPRTSTDSASAPASRPMAARGPTPTTRPSRRATASAAAVVPSQTSTRPPAYTTALMGHVFVPFSDVRQSRRRRTPTTTAGPGPLDPVPKSRMLSDNDLRTMLAAARRIAVLGAHPDPAKPAHYVPDYLHRRGYHVLPANPVYAGRLLWDERVRATLAEIGPPVDIVDVFRRSEQLDAHLDDVLAVRP